MFIEQEISISSVEELTSPPKRPATLREIQESFPMWERGENQETNLAPPLRDVGLALTSIENHGFVTENVNLYIEADARTQAFEAVAPGVIMTTFQAYDETERGLRGYGFLTTDIYKKGLLDIDILRDRFGEKIDFEEQRRTIELLDSINLNEAISTGLMDTHVKVVISPFPVGADKETAQELGYFAEKGIAMVRVLEYDPENKIMTTSQIMVERTDLESFTRLAELLTGEEVEDTLAPHELLATQIYIPKGKLRGGVLDIARIYDRILETSFGERFFLGERVKDEPKDYKNILEKTESAIASTQPIIETLTASHVEIAKSLHDQKPTEFVRKSVQVALQETIDGKSLLSPDKKRVLAATLDGTFDTEAAEILVDFVTKSNYLAMICLTNPKRASQIFEPQDVDAFIKDFLNDPYHAISSSISLIPNQNLVLYACGGAIQINSSTQAMINSSQSKFNSFLREQDAGDGKGPLEFQCKNGHWNTRPLGGLITYCKECGDEIGC